MELDNKLMKLKIRKFPPFGSMELLHAAYVTHSFSRHFHEEYAVGVIEKGALGFQYRGEKHVAYSGTINLANPGEPHNGYPAAESGWTYRMFYFEPRMLEQIVTEATAKKRTPFFLPGVIKDLNLAKKFHLLHRILMIESDSLMEEETMLMETLIQLVARYADDKYEISRFSKNRPSIFSAKEYIDVFYSKNLSITQLAQMANMSPFHFTRSFTQEIGIPPHTYLNQVRIQQAKTRIKQQFPLADIALETGFTDQSHFTRKFKQISGMTPGQYSKMIQESKI